MIGVALLTVAAAVALLVGGQWALAATVVLVVPLLVVMAAGADLFPPQVPPPADASSPGGSFARTSFRGASVADAPPEGSSGRVVARVTLAFALAVRLGPAAVMVWLAWKSFAGGDVVTGFVPLPFAGLGLWRTWVLAGRLFVRRKTLAAGLG